MEREGEREREDVSLADSLAVDGIVAALGERYGWPGEFVSTVD